MDQDGDGWDRDGPGRGWGGVGRDGATPRPPGPLTMGGRGLAVPFPFLMQRGPVPRLARWGDAASSPPSPPRPLDSFWTRNSFETDSDLPAGWMRVQDTSGTYYWHIPTGTTQWEPPAGLARGSGGSTPCEEQSVSGGVWGVSGG